MVTVKAGALADLVRDIFARAGCSDAEAGRIARNQHLAFDTSASIVAAAREVGVDSGASRRRRESSLSPCFFGMGRGLG